MNNEQLMNNEYILNRQIDLLIQTVNMLLITIQYKELKQINKVYDYFINVINNSVYFYNVDSKWYHHYQGEIKYEATIHGINELSDLTQNNLEENFITYRQNLTRLKNFFISIKSMIN